MGRITTWLSASCSNPDSAECGQTVHGLFALADGGWWGVGLGASREKQGWLPSAHNDFIFAVIGEELGLPGTLSVLILFAMLAWACYRLVLGATDQFVRIATVGVMAWVMVQAIVNIGTVIGLLPVIGVPCHWCPRAAPPWSRRWRRWGCSCPSPGPNPLPPRPSGLVREWSVAPWPCCPDEARAGHDRCGHRHRPAVPQALTSVLLAGGGSAGPSRRCSPSRTRCAAATLDADHRPGDRHRPGGSDRPGAWVPTRARPQGAVTASTHPALLGVPGALAGRCAPPTRCCSGPERRYSSASGLCARRPIWPPGAAASPSSSTSRTPAPGSPTGSVRGSPGMSVRPSRAPGFRTPGSSGCRFAPRSAASTGPRCERRRPRTSGWTRRGGRFLSPAGHSGRSGSTRPSSSGSPGSAPPGFRCST